MSLYALNPEFVDYKLLSLGIPMLVGLILNDDSRSLLSEDSYISELADGIFCNPLPPRFDSLLAIGYIFA
jgi:hypothetical protein